MNKVDIEDLPKLITENPYYSQQRQELLLWILFVKNMGYDYTVDFINKYVEHGWFSN